MMPANFLVSAVMSPFIISPNPLPGNGGHMAHFGELRAVVGFQEPGFG